MTQFLQLDIPQCSFHRENVDSLTTACLCCLDQNVPFVKLATCKHCSFFEHMLKYKVRFKQAVVCYQCHSLLKKIELFKVRAEESLCILNKHAKIMKIPSNLDLTYSVIETSTTPNDVLPDYNYSNSPTGPTAKKFKNEKEVSSYRLTEFSTFAKDSLHNNKDHAKIMKTSSNFIMSYSVPEITTITNNILSKYNNSVTRATLKNETEVSANQLTEVSVSCNVKIEKEDMLINSNSNEPKVHSTKLLSVTPSSISIPSTSEKQTVWKGTQYIDKYKGKIKLVTLTKEQLLEERQRNAQKDAYLRQPFKCETCITGFEYAVKYKDHMTKKHTMTEGCFQCTICKSVLKTEKLCKHHEKRHYLRFECCACDHRISNFHLLLRHYNKLHEVIEETTYKCIQCDFVSESYGKYAYHQRKEHRGKHYCNVCDKIFSTKCALQLHIFTKHEKYNKFSCKVCNKIFYQQRSLITHMKSAHADKNVKASSAYCNICNQSYSSKSTLNIHLKYHTKHRNEKIELICHYCGAIFRSKRDIQDHIAWKHINLIFYKCEKCSKAFKNKGSLKRHNKYVHENAKDPKNKVCDICGRAFSKTSILNSHIRTHTGERPFKCTQCPDTFAQHAALYTHNRLKHKKKALAKLSENQ